VTDHLKLWHHIYMYYKASISENNVNET